MASQVNSFKLWVMLCQVFTVGFNLLILKFTASPNQIVVYPISNNGATDPNHLYEQLPNPSGNENPEENLYLVEDRQIVLVSSQINQQCQEECTVFRLSCYKSCNAPHNHNVYFVLSNQNEKEKEIGSNTGLLEALSQTFGKRMTKRINPSGGEWQKIITIPEEYSYQGLHTFLKVRLIFFNFTYFLFFLNL